MCDLISFIERFDTLDLKPCGFEDLTACYKRVNEKRTELDKSSKELKAREEKIKTMLLNKMTTQGLDSLKTKAGHLSIRVSESINTQNIDSFITWLKENPENMDVLSKRPYTQDKVKTLTDDDALPPGLVWYREKKLAIRKGA